ncbi:class I SAM-dependent methyltransferase [Vibrio zhugei]|uniref:Class I SAM-dependent methyltransferase n=1 Tax=Vibrio zhugei TaxID=2479546 RepID=A0ABV7CAR7_9VIBR|nr:class I SAM-dependent methyltransferase [Vibrio zhugei]
MCSRLSEPQQDSNSIPAHLLQPLWFRSRESLSDNGVIYDPIAADVCQRCHLSMDCGRTNLDQQQLLNATLTQQCDQRVRQFLERHPDGWIINLGAGLDTRFYRIDNGRCRWIEVDVSEHLLLRQKLFHRSERYQHMAGSVTDLSWLQNLPMADSTPTLILCEYALLECDNHAVSHVVKTLGLHFSGASVCFVLAGDKTATSLGEKLGSAQYAHGFADCQSAMLNCLPWLKKIVLISPLDHVCPRWKWWQKVLGAWQRYKYRFTPVIVSMRW